jgi:hypothetical protein
MKPIIAPSRIACMLAAGLLAGCMRHGTAAPALDLSLTHPSQSGKYVVELAPPNPAPRVNQLHSWHIQLHTRSGEPVSQAVIAVSGGMPEHGHGFPTQPRVTAGNAAGDYLLEGMKFNMTGWWQIKLAVEAPMGADAVTFNTVLPPSAQ